MNLNAASRGRISVYKRTLFNKYHLKLYLSVICIKGIFSFMTIFIRIIRSCIVFNIFCSCQIEVLLVEVRSGGNSFQRNSE
jgi:hypothetical protein